jgi:hypothetical protein
MLGKNSDLKSSTDKSSTSQTRMETKACGNLRVQKVESAFQREPYRLNSDRRLSSSMRLSAASQ